MKTITEEIASAVRVLRLRSRRGMGTSRFDRPPVLKRTGAVFRRSRRMIAHAGGTDNEARATPPDYNGRPVTRRHDQHDRAHEGDPPAPQAQGQGAQGAQEG